MKFQNAPLASETVESSTTMISRWNYRKLLSDTTILQVEALVAESDNSQEYENVTLYTATISGQPKFSWRGFTFSEPYYGFGMTKEEAVLDAVKNINGQIPRAIVTKERTGSPRLHVIEC